jgi:hypothetical protein
MTTIMAASAAPTPWNRLPPSTDDFRWWDNIFLNFSLPVTFDETPTVHCKQFLAEPHHGKTHKLLVPALEVSFLSINASSFAKVQGDETLRTSIFHSPQTTQSCRIRRNQLGTTPHCTRQPPQLLYLEPVLRGIPHIPQRTPKHLGSCWKNQSVRVLRRSLPLPKQHRRPLSRQGLDHCHKNQGHLPPNNSHPIHKAIGDSHVGRDEDSSVYRDLTAINPQDFHGQYTKNFECMTATNNDGKVDPSPDKASTTRPCSRSCSRSA